MGQLKCLPQPDNGLRGTPPDRDQRRDVYNGEDRGRNRQREEGSSGHHKRIRTGGEFSEHGRDRDSVSDRSHNDESSQRMGDDGHSDPNAPPMRSDRGSHGNSHATHRDGKIAETEAGMTREALRGALAEMQVEAGTMAQTMAGIWVEGGERMEVAIKMKKIYSHFTMT
ncbi:hypothetical protein BASA60_005136 [Batrachochytrium salamandrivorans]|nr:hypothetical protein BASA60_005136 [Batrachochytrium salamandrivorans]